MKIENYPVISPDFSISKLTKDTILLMNYDLLKFKSFNKEQSRILMKCDGTHTVDSIIQELNSICPDVYTNDTVIRFLDRMKELRYIHENLIPIKVNIAGREVKYIENKDYYNPTQLYSITISVTESCCLSCGHCSQSAPLGKGRQFELDKLKEIISDASDLGTRYLGIFGGEPLLYPKLDSVIEFSFEKGYRDIMIFSKGTLINEQRARKLRCLGINQMQISCDSHIPEIYESIVGEKGSFVKFYKGIYSLLNAGIKVLLKVVITNKNIDTIPELIEYFISMGVKTIGLEVVVPVGRADFTMIPSDEKVKKLDTYISQLKLKDYEKYKEVSFKYLKYGQTKSCGGGITSLMVFSDGEVGPCDKWFEYKELFSFGNVYSNSIKEIWNNGKFERFRNLNADEKCQKCQNFLICRGGCPLNSMIIEHSMDKADFACKMISNKDSGQLFVN